MTSLRFLDLTVISGPNQGMRYSTPENTYRILGRYEKGFIADERILNPDQQELILKHLPAHFKFERGPDILLDDQVLSTAHALLSYCGENPIWVNLLTDETKAIKRDDMISIGNTQLKVSQ